MDLSLVVGLKASLPGLPSRLFELSMFMSTTSADLKSVSTFRAPDRLCKLPCMAGSAAGVEGHWFCVRRRQRHVGVGEGWLGQVVHLAGR